MEVAPRYTLFTLFTLLTLFTLFMLLKLLYTATNSSTHVYIYC